MKYSDFNQNADLSLVFPSPCGEEVMKSKICDRYKDGYNVFPSPCGEEVMKSYSPLPYRRRSTR